MYGIGAPAGIGESRTIVSSIGHWFGSRAASPRTLFDLVEERKRVQEIGRLADF